MSNELFFMNTIVNSRSRSWHVILHIVFATLITMYVFYLHEGFINLSWVRDFGKWISFFIYASFFLFGQYLVKWVLLREYSGILQTLLSCIVGSGLELMMALILFIWLSR